MKTINLRCGFCGNAMRVERCPDVDPPEAVELVTSECDICEAASGGFDEALHYDRAGYVIQVS